MCLAYCLYIFSIFQITRAYILYMCVHMYKFIKHSLFFWAYTHNNNQMRQYCFLEKNIFRLYLFPNTRSKQFIFKNDNYF